MNTQLRIPKHLLPADDDARDELLCDYFCERVADSRADGNEWIIDLTTAPSVDFYPDELLTDGLAWWEAEFPIEAVPLAWRDMGGWHLSLNDAWTLFNWSTYFTRIGRIPDGLVILHVDDHDDLMTPRVSIDGGSFVDLLTGSPIDLTRSSTVESAVRSGAVAQGSFLAPILHAARHVEIRHLCQTRYARERIGAWFVEPTFVRDSLLDPGSLRPGVGLAQGQAIAGQSRYLVTSDVDEWVADLPEGEVLLHVDFDYFNNRFNGDSDWRRTSDRHDPPVEDVLERIDQMLASIRGAGLPVSATAAALSPGFFPAEMWEPAVGAFAAGIERVLRR